MEEDKPIEQKPSEEVKQPDPQLTDKVLQIKMENDALEAEMNRRENLKAKLELGGRAIAGQREKTPEEVAKEEAKKLLGTFGY